MSHHIYAGNISLTRFETCLAELSSDILAGIEERNTKIFLKKFWYLTTSCKWAFDSSASWLLHRRTMTNYSRNRKNSNRSSEIGYIWINLLQRSGWKWLSLGYIPDSSALTKCFLMQSWSYVGDQGAKTGLESKNVWGCQWVHGNKHFLDFRHRHLWAIGLMLMSVRNILFEKQ